MKTNKESAQSANLGILQVYSFWILIVIIVITSVIRFRLLTVPLERDEGEYAYAGQLMLQCIPPYEKAYNMKMPGIYAAYAGIMGLFGQTVSGIHLGLLVVNIFTIILVFLIGKELFDPVTGLFAGAAFALLSLGQTVFGFFAHAEHFVILPALAGILLLKKTLNSRQNLLIFFAGLLLGTAFMIMQHGAAFIIFGGLILLINFFQTRPFNLKIFATRVILFSLGVFLPFIAVCLILWHFGVFERFWFWTFDYARHYVGMVPLYNGLYLLKEGVIKITSSSICLWILAAIGLIFTFSIKKFRREVLFVFIFFVCSFLAICPGLYFREHYYILLLPAVAILAGIGSTGIYNYFVSSGKYKIKFVPLILMLFVFVFTLYQQRNFFFFYSPRYISCISYGLSPFVESLKISDLIKAHSEKTDTIGVIGSEPEIYFYSNRKSATGYIYTYALMEEQPYALKMKEEMINQIEQASPKFLVVVGTPTSWLTRVLPDEQQRISTLLDRYPLREYNLIGAIDVISVDKAIYCWGRNASTYVLQSPSWLAILLHKRYGNPEKLSWLPTGIIEDNRSEKNK